MSAIIRDIRKGFKGPVTDKFVLLTLATYADKTGLAWPGQPRLAEDVGISARHLRRILDKLMASGWLVVLYRGDGRGKSTRYHIGKPIIKADTHVHLSGGNGVVKADIQGIERRTPRTVKVDIAMSTDLLRTVREQSLGAGHPRKVVRQRKRKTAWPHGFALSPEMRDYAITHGVADPELQFELFRNYALNHPNWLHVNWTVAWRNWVLHAKQFAAERAQATSRPTVALVRRLPTPEEVRAQDAAALARRGGRT